MAKLTIQKARKEYHCAKCGALIKVGEQYYKIVERFRTPQIRCLACKPSRSELTNSEYLSTVYDLQDNLHIGSESDVDDIKDQVQQLEDECQEKLENIPEQLQEAEAGQKLQDRIDACENCISDLDSLDYPDVEEMSPEEAKEAWSDLESEVEEALNQLDI